MGVRQLEKLTISCAYKTLASVAESAYTSLAIKQSQSPKSDGDGGSAIAQDTRNSVTSRTFVNTHFCSFSSLITERVKGDGEIALNLKRLSQFNRHGRIGDEGRDFNARHGLGVRSCGCLRLWAYRKHLDLRAQGA